MCGLMGSEDLTGREVEMCAVLEVRVSVTFSEEIEMFLFLRRGFDISEIRKRDVR